ncbi:MAG: AAA family ATPase [Cocleimonas sp.]
MLINSLQAINFRKYHRLEVDDIPQKGVITVAGLNESGKTSIGEAICFVLFGRTFFLDDNNLHKIVCWGRDSAEVTLNFTSAQGDSYRLWRSINRQGEMRISLQQNSDKKLKDANKPIKDTEKVTLAISKLLSFDYDAFANSFYLAQRELTSPDPQSDTIKQMAGIGSYAEMSNDFDLASKTNKEKITGLLPQRDKAKVGLDAIKLDETWLPEMVDAETTLGTEQQSRESLIQQLDENNQSYRENKKSYGFSRTVRGIFGFLSALLIPVTVILCLWWAAQQFYPEALGNLIESFLGSENKEKFSQHFDTWILPSAILSLIALVISFLFNKQAKQNISILESEASSYSQTMDEGHRHVTTPIESLLPERVVQKMYEKVGGSDSTLQVIPPREHFNNLDQLVEDTPNFNADPEEVSAAIGRLTSSLKKQDGEIEDLNKGLIKDISVEKVRSDEAGAFRSTIKDLQRTIDKNQYSIDTQTIAVGMLQRAANDSVQLFNDNIAKTSANTLPKFTEGRYSKIRIADDFSVQVYSDEKSGYMDFDEISSGTQRQVMLALRMAMSEELAKNTGNDKQFIFLDEPFAFFDQTRTRSTLEALPDVSKVITQIWVVAQEFPADVKVNKAIVCPLDKTELRV